MTGSICSCLKDPFIAATSTSLGALQQITTLDTPFSLGHSKALDQVPTASLLHNLNTVGINGNLCQWFASYLADRMQLTRDLDSLTRCSNDYGVGFSSTKSCITSRRCSLPADASTINGNPFIHSTGIEDLHLRHSCTFSLSHQVQLQSPPFAPKVADSQLKLSNAHSREGCSFGKIPSYRFRCKIWAPSHYG
ncbi:LOW QUALITY PROTEIN: hypothetical protein T265_12498 [Opisthorchis viverrini]|uniref:Uncharacterized protein n=1 Tax=Opisthorchis viverrini TaxID=6198 RepID=A0A075A6S9_OPIVI|nr:LOW QUALITY PROTEIN: hypothetical protein T265_12498 [Opisthorchis viverrini]KER34077.1 LOW QUALITY PROTEIN: hypothetical protein T265_12498 [Opisthorchis viverrini]